MKKSRRAKACDISRSVKRAVYARDGGMCILCGRPGLPNAHFIPRSHNGLGIEENILTLCPDCHMRYDQSPQRAEIRARLEAYLKRQHPGWDEKNLYYRKVEYEQGNHHRKPGGRS